MLGTQVANILEVCLLLILIWVLWFECWQKYRVDLFRQNLFELRDTLFDFAATAGIDFSHPAYRTQRDSINSMIRFGHRVTMIRLLIGLVTQRFFYDPYEEARINRMDKIFESVEDTHAREEMGKIRRRFHILIRNQLICCSPTAIIMWILFFVYFTIHGAAKSMQAVMVETFVQKIEEQAFAAEYGERLGKSFPGGAIA